MGAGWCSCRGISCGHGALAAGSLTLSAPLGARRSCAIHRSQTATASSTAPLPDRVAGPTSDRPKFDDEPHWSSLRVGTAKVVRASSEQLARSRHRVTVDRKGARAATARWSCRCAVVRADTWPIPDWRELDRLMPEAEPPRPDDRPRPGRAECRLTRIRAAQAPSCRPT